MRNPKVALALSLIMPGLGHVYNGELTKGLSLFLIFAFAIPVFAWIGINIPPALWVMVLIGSVIALAVYVFCVVDSYKVAKRIGENYELGSFNRVYAYLALLLFAYFFVLMQLTNYTMSHITQFFSSPSSSMIPNILPGDRFFADKRVNSPGSRRQIRRGDVGVFIYPNDRTTVFMKRIIGLPGDRLEIADGRVSINGTSITEGTTTELGSSELNAMLTDHVATLEKTDSGTTYPVLWKRDSPQRPTSLTIPAGYVYLLGDNRDDSVDSRTFGPVALIDVIGIAKQVMLSSSGNVGLRMGRIGKSLDLN